MSTICSILGAPFGRVRSVNANCARGHDGRASSSAIRSDVLERIVARSIPQRCSVRKRRSSVEIPQSSIKAPGTFGISLTGGEPTMHPDLPRIIRTCRQLRFYRTSMISNGFLLRRELIETLNKAGLQRMQLSIDGVQANETTEKVLNNLKKRLQWL